MTRVRPEGLDTRLASLAQTMAPYGDQMTRALVDLCRIPSVKGEPLPEAPYGAETARALARFLAIGTELGFRAVNLDNRVGYVEYGQGRRLVAVLAHLDVVPAGDGWQTDPFEPVVLPDRIIARGAIDDKGPLVAALFALKALADEGFQPDARIRIIAGLDEECGSSCMQHYARIEELPDAGFTPDADFPVINAEKGIVSFDLVVRGGQPAADSLRLVAGRAGSRTNVVPGQCHLLLVDASGEQESHYTGQPAHASTPWKGQNAIAAAMADVQRRLADAGCRHPFVDFYNQAIGMSWRGEGLRIAGEDASGPLTLNAGVLKLDEQEGRLSVDIRYPVTWSLDRLLAAMQPRLAELGAELEIVRNSPPLYYPPESPLINTLAGILQDLTGFPERTLAIGGGTYARTMPNIVAFGPTFPGDPETMHQPGEYITQQTLGASAAIFRQALRQLAQ